MKILLIDFETQSPCPITKGTDNYASHPETDILCMAYGFIGEKPALWGTGDNLPDDVVEHLANGGLIAASNAAFDKAIWEYIAVPDYGFPAIKPEQWYCTQAQTRVAGLPSGLDHSARALGIGGKLSNGNALIRKCCVPPYSTDPQDYIDLGEYCLQDWRVMDEVMRATPLMMQHLHDDWVVNEKINDRGILIDIPLAKAAVQYAEAEREQINRAFNEITGFDVTQHRKIAAWLWDALTEDGCHNALKLMKRGEKISSDKNVRANLLADPELWLADDVLEALQLLEDAGGSATAKFGKMLGLASEDGRVRGAIRCFGAASTLRYSSMGLQIHNMRNDSFHPDEAEALRGAMLAGEPLDDTMDTLGRMLRPAIIPAPGKVFVVADWSAVESRMTAWLAGDNDKLDLFRRGDDPYVYAAEGIYPGQTIDKDKRQVGKVTDLACGFLGGAGALAAMAAQFRIPIPAAEREKIVEGWRAKHPKIERLGDKLLRDAMKAMNDRGIWHGDYLFAGDDALYCKLADGKTLLRYPDARIEPQETPWGEMRPNITALKAAFKPKVGDKEWPRHSLWRGLLLENQAQANCCLMLRDVVYEMQDVCVFHVHDEVVLEVPEKHAEGWAKELQIAMETPPEWAPDLPLVAEPEILTRFKGK